MTKLKDLRIKIQREANLSVDDVAKEVAVSVKSLYRIEDLEKFNASIFIKYLEFLRKNKIDINKVLKEIFEEDEKKKKIT